MSVTLNASSFDGPGSSFTIPYNTLRAVSAELVTLSEELDKLQIQMVVTVLSTISMGIHTACAAYAAKLQLRDGRKGFRRTLLYITASMYAATLISWVAVLVTEFRTLHTVKSDLAETSSWIPPSDCFLRWSTEDVPAYCTTIPAVEPSLSGGGGWDSTQDCVGTVMLSFNVVLGDAIVWWRVWVLWNKSRPILVACCVILLATLVFGAFDSEVPCSRLMLSDILDNPTADGAFFGGSFLGLSAIGLSLLSNVVATLLVGYKAWKHRIRAKKHFARVPGVTRVQRALMLLVESGVGYCILWALVLSSQVSWTTSSPSGLTTWSNGMVYFTEGFLVAFVGIYPTLIIILVALNKSEIEKQSLAFSMPAISTVQPSPVRVELATDDVLCATDGSIHDDMRPHSVVLINMPLSTTGSPAQLSEATSEDGTECDRTES